MCATMKGCTWSALYTSPLSTGLLPWPQPAVVKVNRIGAYVLPAGHGAAMLQLSTALPDEMLCTA